MGSHGSGVAEVCRHAAHRIIDHAQTSCRTVTRLPTRGWATNMAASVPVSPRATDNSMGVPDYFVDHVHFRYRPERPDVLNGVSLEIAPGQMIGLVGPSGSGKSTLAKLFQRLHVPSQGRVLVDGQDLALLDPTWLRQNVGVVLQENRLFNRTVRENIALRDPAMPMEFVMQAAKLAGAHEFILELPEGYDTVVGEQGASLSGGQRQRIALARALVTNPKILILDEATSALDYESEATIQANMRLIAKGRTVVIIAHRLTAVRHADVIYVIERGRVVEQGTHKELVERAGHYARLYSHQAEGAVVTPIGS